MEKSTELLQNLYDYFIEVSPRILIGIGFVILSILIYRIIVWVIRKLLKFSKINKLNSKINQIEFFENSNFKIDISKIIVGFVKFILILILLIIGSEMLNLEIISEQISILLAYMPRFLSGLLIFSIGIYIAAQLKKVVYNTLKSFDAGGSKLISSLVFYLISIFITITAINQIGIDTEIISTNLSYIIGAALITVTIAVGLGSRDIIHRLLLGYYTKKNLKTGMKIRMNEVTGIIESIDNICLILKTDEQRIIIPIKEINESKITIIEEFEQE